MRIGVRQNLASALGIAGGVVCMVGAGGKKTAMYELATSFEGRVALTSTSHMFEYDESVVDEVIITKTTVPKSDLKSRVVAYAGDTDTPNRVGGLQSEKIRTIWEEAGYDLLVIKADGARSRLIKAPANHEPLIPDFAELVVPVVSGLVVGQPLTEKIAHRVDLLADVMEMVKGSVVAPVNIARLLSSQNGSLRGTKDIRVVPIINMVDSSQILATCTEAALLAFERTSRFDRVVLTELRSSAIVRIIDRPIS